MIAGTLPACGEVLGADFEDKKDDCSIEGELRCEDGLVCQSGKWVTDPGDLTCQGQEVVACKNGTLETIETCKGPCVGAGECRLTVKLGVSFENACALLDDGSVWCWGSAYQGALGRDPGTPWTATPAPVPGLEGVVDFGLGTYFGCARRDTGRVACWGANTAGQLGSGAGEWRMEALDIESLHDISELFVAAETACARAKDGTFECWGRAHYPCMKEASDGWAAFYPVPLPELSTASRVFSGPGMVCGTLEPDHDLYCCDDEQNTFLPYPKNGEVSNVLTAGGGSDHLCVETNEGLRCWGVNTSGQLCNGKAVQGLDESLVATEPLSQIAIGPSNTYLLESKGGVLHCCGDNTRSQCGQPSIKGDVYTVPRRVKTDVLWVGGGSTFACALTKDHVASCWGDNAFGGTGTREFLVAEPTPVVWHP